ncbi:MAG TPA: MBL fold metallo-hydrolase, partial [Thermoanaerobaculia bacterium]|nr:MBL fold metallo-hydrolase [Thermoanaerobaculia bacterium]
PKELEEAKKAGNAEDVKLLEDAIAWAKKVKIEEIAAPVVTFDSELRIHLNGETVEVWHTPPAHTDGDSVVYFRKANVVHMGDLYFHDSIPFIDVNSGGSARGYLAAIDQVLARVPPDVTVIPGHGEVSDVAGLKRARQFVADLLDAARAARAAGKTKEQFLASADLPAYGKYDGYKDRFKGAAAVAWDDVVVKP